MTTPRAATRARQAALQHLLHGGVTSVPGLADALDVSTSTVRRDLDRMSEAGQVARTYGGARLVAAFEERSVADSAREGTAAKSAVARRAYGLLPDRGRVFIDAGTTCGALAWLLAAAERDDRSRPGRLAVVTRGLETALALASSAEIDLEVVGGRVRRLSHGLVGPLSAMALTRMAFDIAFLGADVVDLERGIGEPTLEETVVKEQVAARSGRTVVLADARKLAGRHAPTWTSLTRPWTLVTDADDEQVPGLSDRARTHGVELVRTGRG